MGEAELQMMSDVEDEVMGYINVSGSRCVMDANCVMRCH